VSTINDSIDLKQLVRWLGADGARAGLLQSKRLTTDVLRQLATSLDVKLPEKGTRQQLIDEIVKVAARRIDKPIHELLEMDERTLIDYFERIEVESAELLEILKQLDVSPHRESRRSLLEFAARELSETGLFMRIAGTQSEQSETHDAPANGGKRDARKRNTATPPVENDSTVNRPS
jgi:hypothetical protein